MSSNEDKYNRQLTRLGERKTTREEQIWFRKYNALQRSVNELKKDIRILKGGKNIVASSPTIIINPTIAHSATTGKTVDDHHNKLHAAQHLSGQDDPLGIPFDDIINPNNDVNFTFGNKHLHLTFVNPDTEGGLILEGLGNFQGKTIVHLHQHTGNVTAEAWLRTVEWIDAQITPERWSNDAGTNWLSFKLAALSGARTLTYPDKDLTFAIDTAAEAIAAVEAAGLALASTKVITSADEELIFTFGKLGVGFNSAFANRMILAHRALNNDNDYAISQSVVGDTYFNIKTGRTGWFLVNSSSGIFNYNASGLQMGISNARINEFSTDGTMTGNSDVAVPTEKAVKTYADTKATAAEAIAAVEGEATLDFTDSIVTITSSNASGFGLKITMNIAGTPVNEIKFHDQGGSTGSVGHSSAASNDMAIAAYNDATAYIRFWINGNNRMSLDPSGNLTLDGTVDGVDIAARDHAEPPEITQANAEAGTATVFSQWSAERVAQAIASLGASFTEGANKLQIGDILIQWGIETTGFAGGTKVVSFPVAYTSTPVVSANSSSASTTSTVATEAHVNATALSTFTLQNRNIIGTNAPSDSTSPVSWIAIGINNA